MSTKIKAYRDTQHTPGPWTIDSEGNLYGNIGIIRPYIGNLCDDYNDEQSKANARLIAAAPELLAALKCALADLEGSLQAHEQMDRLAHDWDAHKQSIDEASAAIAKAEGRAE